MTHQEIHALNFESRYGYIPAIRVSWYARVWRVPRFFTLAEDLGSSVGEFEGLSDGVMDGEAVVVERKKDEE